jgi:hypothetical protein
MVNLPKVNLRKTSTRACGHFMFGLNSWQVDHIPNILGPNSRKIRQTFKPSSLTFS